ncbi:hypothetical protein EPO14_02250 [Patescibacteria group bacterium]|nr:MAG: hypothetical protein EPO14_02250 [Patescibacteria group bacterium]
MDIEDLSKFQIVLLVILVSFVTSIATGIVTVSLLAAAPTGVTQTINQVVERTIQTIVPTNISTPATTKETTVVVKEDDLITASISASLGKTGRVFSGISTTTPIVGLAAQIGPALFVTDSSIVDKDHLVIVGGTSAVYTVSQQFPEVGIAFLVPKDTNTKLGAPFRIGDVGALKLGATTVALVSVTQERVVIGAVSSRTASTDVVPVKGASAISVRNIDTNINATLVPGTPLVNIFGDLVGIATSVSQASGGNGTFIATSDILTVFSSSHASSTPAKAK